MKQKSIHLITTGGTIDSHYDGTKDTAVTNKESVIPEYIKSLKLFDKVIYTPVCMKDSRALSNTDRLKMINAINKSSLKSILITHGTYTMPDTARFISKRLVNGGNKVIIITGSMIPLVGFSPSDAGFNLGFAIGKFDSLEPGIYVAMNGQIFNPDEVIKLLNEGRFSSILNK